MNVSSSPTTGSDASPPNQQIASNMLTSSQKTFVKSCTPSPDPTKLPCDKKWITLNIGGKYFTTTRVTLSKAPNSFLHKLSLKSLDPRDIESDRDERGAFLIDRDPLYFQVVLNYLRHGKLIMNKGLLEEGVLEEAEFYNITDLIKLTKQKIIERDNVKAANENKKYVYRVLQCHAHEVTQMVSTLSDGWKFEQMINSRPSTGDYSTEFLCVVSRECMGSSHINGSHKPEPNDRAKLIQQKASAGIAIVRGDQH